MLKLIYGSVANYIEIRNRTVPPSAFPLPNSKSSDFCPLSSVF